MVIVMMVIDDNTKVDDKNYDDGDKLGDSDA